MSDIIDKIRNLFKLPKPRQASIPPPLILKAKTRSGTSQTRVAERVFTRENEIFDSDQPHRQAYRIIIEEVLKEIRENAVVEIAIPPNAIIIGAGSDATGTPVTVTCQIVNIQTATGVIK